MSPADPYPWLAPAAARGDLVVTSSRRLARELGAAYDAAMIAAGRSSWATPAIRFWQDWLGEALESAECDDLPQLLEGSAATLLWEQALERTGREDLLSVGGVVRHAQAAWTRLHDWQVAPDAVAASAASRDEHWFVRASRAYAARLAAHGWIDAAELLRVATEQAGRAEMRWPRRIVHAGFDRLTPAFQGLLAALRGQGVAVTEAPQPARAAEPRFRSYGDADALWRAAGHWARATLVREPNARIAVLAPDLESDAARIGRLVREGFAPGWQLGTADYRDAVNVSYGQRLAAYPAVAVALQCLGFAAAGLKGAEISVLLRSPFIAAGDPGGRARLELALRELPDRRWTPPDLLAALDESRSGDSGRDWRGRCAALARLYRMRDERLAPAAWAGEVDAALAALGWPGPGGADSDEFQLVNRWRQLLNQLARLDRVRPSLTLAEATRRLRQIAADTVFQPEAEDGALPVLGLLESAGLEFDHLWVGGIDASRWPPARHPLALVNRRLQRDTGMPDATPADTLEFAQRRLDGLRAAARELCFAWARRDGDVELAPSPLLGPAAGDAAVDEDDPGWFAAQAVARGGRCEVEDDPAPAVSADEKIHGGAYTVQLMQQEPFAAFARGRLAAEPFERFRPGLTPRLRGILVHRALEALLREQPTRRELLAWTDLGERIERAARRARGPLGRHADAVLGRVLALEQTRLERLLGAFVEQERERDEFAIVALEQAAELRRGPVRLDLRIDRIDRLADGSLLLADYKTGTARRFLGRDRNPKNVQLSVYACAVDEPVGALALINVDSREISYDGAGPGFASGRTRISADDWPATLERWRGQVDALLVRFAAGEIGVNVLQPAKDARPLALLSRIEELRRGA